MILKKEYELSVWDETLGEKGQKEEIKQAIIGAHDMDFLGRATSLKLSRKINGTNILTFQLPSRYFDDKVGDYVHNEFCDYVFNEKKVKLKYDGEWFEFYVKNISESKQHKTIIYQYSCEDAFIDELARNGYGITFDTELYNNVEEIGIFTEQILKDSVWTYNAEKNWGDFTEFSKEKLFRIPVSQFKKLIGHKIVYKIPENIKNTYTHQERNLEIGDDLARVKNYYWDNGNFDKGLKLLGDLTEIENDGYIYIPYSCLNFCYIKQEENTPAATEIPATWPTNGTTYCLAPSTIDPTHLIQFIAIPHNAEVHIDEDGLLIDKEYSYVMTLKEWNENVNTGYFYDVENNIKINTEATLTSNSCVYYDGYLDFIGDKEISFGKKISITDRTEINIDKEIDQYVLVYNNTDKEYNNLYTSEDWVETDLDYRVCSYDETRVIVPQLARNLVQNGTKISELSGWDVMATSSNPLDISSSIELRYKETDEEITEVNGLILDTNFSIENLTEEDNYRTFLNFGIVGQEEKIKKDQTYVLSIKGEWVDKTVNKNSAGEDIYETSSNIKDLTVLLGEGGFDSNGNYFLSKENNISFEFKSFQNNKETYFFIRPLINIENPYFAIRIDKNSIFNLTEACFFKAYTKGLDFFENTENCVIKYKYSGRDIFFNEKDWCRGDNIYYRQADKNEFLSEVDIIEGNSYSYKKYFRQQIQFPLNGKIEVKDTFKLKSYLNTALEKNGLDPIKYTDDEYSIVTDYIDLNKCSYYNCNAQLNDKDCNHKSSNGVCMYQKYGYCPYLFQTQKHCRKIRTLNGEKSNRFNLTQELSSIFQVYPVYHIEHENNGKILKDKDGRMIKNIFYITEKGTENKLGFRYEKNLSNISRTFNSKQIVTKLYVEDVDSELSNTGLCSIKLAQDNPSKDNYIIDFSYYILRGLLNKNKTNADLYGIDNKDLGYLKTIGYLNSKYDELTNKIINLQDKSFTELTANIEVNLTGIETAQQELNKIKKNLIRYSQKNTNDIQKVEESDVFKTYKIKYNEQKNILLGLIESTFMSDNNFGYFEDNYFINSSGTPNDLLLIIDQIGFKTFKQLYLDTFKYKNYGMMGQYTAEYLQIQEWKKERAKYLAKINEISLSFYQKYEPYLKEGVWSDSNYLTDNAYYFGAKEVAKESSLPKINYNISVIDLSVLDEDYNFKIADTTYIEDVDIFGINTKTGLPNRLKVIISGITYDLDIPTQNSIEIQNYSSQFEDLFQQINATVQSISFNENIYKRSSNFTPTQNVSGESLQGGLAENQLTLLNTDENNIQLDYTGQHGSDINNHNNKYRLDGQGLFFSNNGGETWSVGVTPKGINADYINVGSLDASKIQIVDGNYLYFLWDKSGITAYRSPQATKGDKLFQDFAKFNKYGLSLVENGKIRLRAGYGYQANTEAHGDFNQEKELNQTSKIGFYLYDDNGREIFKTENGTDSAKISLLGEMFITDTVNEQTVVPDQQYYYENGIRLENTTVPLLEERVFKNYEIKNKALDENVAVNNVIEIIYNNINNTNVDFNEIYSYIIYAIKNKYIEIKENLNNIFIITIKSKENDIEIIERHYKKYASINESKILGVYNDILSKEISSIEMEINNLNNVSIIEGDTITDLSYTLGEKNKERLYLNNETPLQVEQNITIKILREKTSEKMFSDYEAQEMQNVSYYEEINNNYEIRNGLYFQVSINGFNYWEKKQLVPNNETPIQKNGAVSLYLNNTNTEQENRAFNERLICCAKQVDQNKTNNIFSILKGGNLYIGGTIINADTQENIQESQNMPIEIDILSPLLMTDSTKGKIKLDFDNLVDVETNETLMEHLTVAGSGVGPHRHQIKKLTVSAIENAESTAYLPSDDDIFTFSTTLPGYENQTLSITDSSQFSGTTEEKRNLQILFNFIIGLLKNGKSSLTYIGNNQTSLTKEFTFSKKIVSDSSNFDLILNDSWTETTSSSGASSSFSGYGLVDPIGGE